MTRALRGRRIALVTGASRGLGFVISGLLRDEGFDLVLTARNRGDLTRAARALRMDGGPTVIAVAGDVADPRHQKRLTDAIGVRGRLDVLVNNASELGPSPLRSLVSYPLADLEHVFRVNMIAPLGLVQTLLGPLSRARGLVVNISSDAAVGGYPGWGGYGASKAALDLVSRTLAKELAERGISVTSVDPGDMRTGMHQAAFPGEDIGDRPLPEVTLPFWAWLFHQDRTAITGQRFQAQSDRWEVPA